MHPAYQPTLAEPGKSRAALVAGHPTRYLPTLQPHGSCVLRKEPSTSEQREGAFGQRNPLFKSDPNNEKSAAPEKRPARGADQLTSSVGATHATMSARLAIPVTYLYP